MSQPDIEDRPDLNTGEPWSEMDLFDLANSVRLGDPIEKLRSSYADPVARSATRSLS